MKLKKIFKPLIIGGALFAGSTTAGITDSTILEMPKEPTQLPEFLYQENWYGGLANLLCSEITKLDERPGLKSIINPVFEVLEKTKQGRASLENAKLKKYIICMDETNDGKRISREAFAFKGVMGFNYNMFKDKYNVASSFVHESRHANQMDEKISSTSHYDLKDSMVISKAMEADAYVRSVILIDELLSSKIMGDADLISALDIKFYRIYKDKMSDGNRNSALRAVFDAFFTSDAIPFYEAGTVNFCNRTLNQDVPKEMQCGGFKVLTEKHLLPLGALPNGSNYLIDTGGFDINAKKYRSIRDIESREAAKVFYQRRAAQHKQS